MSADTVITLPDTNDARSGRGDTTVHRNNFVERGCGFTVDFDQGICYVDRGIIHYVYDETYYRVEVNTSTDSNVLDLEASASHDVYYDFDAEQLVVTTGSAPSEPRLKIGTVDTATETYDDTHNRDPTRFGPSGSASNPSAAFPSTVGEITAYAQPGGGSTKGLQARIDELAAEGGGRVICTPGEYAQGANDPLLMKDNVTVDGMAVGRVKLTVEDGLGDDVPHVVSFRDGVTDAHLKNVEVDGNESGNPNGSFSADQMGCVQIEDNDNNNRPVRCSVQNAYLHDSIRSSLIMSGENCVARNVWAENSRDDHHVYVSRGKNCTLDGIYCSGYTGGTDKASLTVGTSNFPAIGNSLENIWVTDPVTNPYNSEYPEIAVDLRRGVSETGGTTIDGLHLKYESGEDGQKIDANHQCTINGLQYRGPCEFQNLVEHTLVQNYGTITFNDPQVIITDTSRAGGRVFLGDKPGLRINGGYIEETTTSVYDGVEVYADATIDGTEISTGGHAIDTFTGAGEEIEIGVYNLRTDNSSRINFAGDGSSIYLAHETMLPQRTADIGASFLFRGRINYEDGGGGNTEGPAFYDGSQWVSVVDGTTWT